MPMRVTVENLTKVFDYHKAVDSVSFQAKRGEIIGLLGPNGAGKSTTLQMLAGLLAPTHGQIFFDNLPQEKYPHKVKRFIGYLPEKNPLYDTMNVIDFLFFITKLYGVPRYKMTSRVLDMLSLCGLNNEKHKLIRELSRGYRQRLGIAQAMIHDPEILLLDEPTTGLDPNQSFGIREIIKTIGQEKTVILSTHILPEIEATCDRVIIMSKGRVMASGTTTELRRVSSNELSLKIGIKGGDHHAILLALQALPQVQTLRPLHRGEFELQCQPEANVEKAIFDTCKQHDWYITEMTPVQTALEDIFRKVTQN